MIVLSKPKSKKEHELPDAHMNRQLLYLKTKPEPLILSEYVTVILNYVSLKNEY